MMLLGATLALSVLGCRNEGKDEYDQTRSPDPATPPGESTPPLVEDEDAIGEDDDYTDDARPRNPEGGMPPTGDPLSEPTDPDMPEAEISSSHRGPAPGHPVVDARLG